MDSQDAGAFGNAQGDFGQVHAVADDALFQVILDFIGSHFSAALFALRGGRAQVGQAHHMGGIRQRVAGKVGHVSGQLPFGDGFLHIFRNRQFAAGEVHDAHALFQAADERLVDGAAGGIHERDMEGDVIRVLHRRFHAVGVMDGGGQGPGVLHGDVGVIAHHVHAHAPGSGVGHQRADGSQADDRQLFAAKLRAHELALFLLHQLFQAFRVLVFLYPGDAARDVAGGQQQARDDQFRHGVGVRAGGIEHHDALLGAFLDGDVVDARARPRNRQQGIREYHVVHGGAAHQDGVGGGFLGGHRVLPRGQDFVNDGRNAVQGLDFIHDGFAPFLF